MSLTFRVDGTPAPKGSTRAFVVGRRAIVTEANRNVRPWAALVADAARQALADEAHSDGIYLPTGPVNVTLTFWLPRPAAAPKRKPAHPIGRRLDLDKLVRAVLDALTGICWTDDGQVTVLVARKVYTGTTDVYASRPGVVVTVMEA